MGTILFFIAIGIFFYYFIQYQNNEEQRFLDKYLEPDVDDSKEDILPHNHDYIVLMKHKYEYLKSDQWQHLRKVVLDRNNHKCMLCPNTTKLNVHHITYQNLFNEKLYQLKTLCSDCHTNLHYDIGFPTKDIDTYKSEYFWSMKYEKLASDELVRYTTEQQQLDKLLN